MELIALINKPFSTYDVELKHCQLFKMDTVSRTLNPQPSTLHPQPSTFNPQPSTLNPQPSALSPQPSTLNPQPSTLNLNPQPSTPNPQPQSSTLNPQPSTPNSTRDGGCRLVPGALAWVLTLIWTSIYDKHSGLMKITARPDHISHGQTASGKKSMNRWTSRVLITHTRRDLN